ncbi:hypothetical protein Q7P36_000990 [Cladosporium allicinum]
MIQPFHRRAKTAPSHYPRVPFHLLRFGQLLSSLVVGGIMSFFMYHLTHDHWKTPWTFILLMTSSFFSVAALTLTIVLHCCVGLKPDLNIAINGFLALIWAVSWSLLTWYMAPTLTHYCDVEHWQEDAGIMVCRIYKALFAFAFLGLISTLAALCLDFHVRRNNNKLGMYRLHDIDTKQQQPQQGPSGAPRGPFTDEGHGYGSGGIAEPRDSEVWEAPRLSLGPYSEQGTHSNGYAVPDAQFGYDDTRYYGGHEERR